MQFEDIRHYQELLVGPGNVSSYGPFVSTKEAPVPTYAINLQSSGVLPEPVNCVASLILPHPKNIDALVRLCLRNEDPTLGCGCCCFFLIDLLAFVLAELVRSPTVSRCRVQHWWQIQGRDLELVIPRIPGRVEEGWRRRILRPLYLITTSTALGSFIVSQLERTLLFYYVK